MDIKLYEIGPAYLSAVQYMEQYAEEHDGEIPDDLSRYIDELEGTYQEKLISCAHVYKNYMAEAEAIKAEEKRLSERRKHAENRADGIKGYIAMYLKAGDKIDTPTAVLTWKKSEAVEVLDESVLPKEFQRVKVEADKVEIKKALKAGRVVNGAVLVVRDNLQIK